MKSDYDILLELCRLLLPEDPTLEKEVRLSIIQPTSFKTQIKLVLQDWISKDSFEEAIPWYTLIHGLYQRGLLFELSARDAADAMDHDSNLLFEALQTYEASKQPKQPTHYIDSLLTMTSSYLLQNQYVLGELRLPNRTATLLMIPAASAAKCAELFTRLGHGELIVYQTNHQINTIPACPALCSANSLPV